MGLVLDSTFDRLANAVHRFAKFGLSNWFDIACCFKFRKTICLHIFRLLANKGNSLQRLLSPLMPVSVLLQLSDLVFASDLVIGGFFYLYFIADIFVNLPVLSLLHSQGGSIRQFYNYMQRTTGLF